MGLSTTECEEIKGLRGDVLEYVAPVCVPRTGRQGIPQIDAEVAEKGHLWMETRYVMEVQFGAIMLGLEIDL